MSDESETSTSCSGGFVIELEASVDCRNAMVAATGRRGGVYFFFEPGEVRSNGESRVVRVGYPCTSRVLR